MRLAARPPAGLLVLGLLAWLVACTPAAAPSATGDSPPPAPKPRRIVVAIGSTPLTLNESINHTGVGAAPGVDDLEGIYNPGLVALDGNDLPAAVLAEALPTVENGLWQVFPDGTMETTVAIRRGATWHDGMPVTAADLTFAVQISQDPSLPMFSSTGTRNIAGITAVDERTVAVRWKQPFIEADRLFGQDFALPLPRHLLEPSYQSGGARFTELPYWSTELVANGPFKVASFDAGSRMLLTAYDSYVLGRPQLDSIEVRFFSDARTLYANLLAGEVNLTLGRGLSLEQAVGAEEQLGSRVRTMYFLANWVAYYPQFVDPDPAVIGNVAFRRALLHGTDRQQLVETIQLGRVPVAHSFLPTDNPYHAATVSSVVTYDYDPRKTAQMIQDLGYALRPDGFYYDAGGTKLVVETRTTGGDDVVGKMLLSVADMWRRLGVDVSTLFIPAQRAQDRQWRVTRPGFEAARQPADLTNDALRRFTTAEVPTATNNWSGQNRTRYSNPDLDGLVAQFLSTIPADARTAVAGRIVHLLSDQLVAMPIFYTPQPYLVTSDLADNLRAHNPAFNAQDWALRE